MYPSALQRDSDPSKIRQKENYESIRHNPIISRRGGGTSDAALTAAFREGSYSADDPYKLQDHKVTRSLMLYSRKTIIFLSRTILSRGCGVVLKQPPYESEAPMLATLILLRLTKGLILGQAQE